MTVKRTRQIPWALRRGESAACNKAAAPSWRRVPWVGAIAGERSDAGRGVRRGTAVDGPDGPEWAHQGPTGGVARRRESGEHGVPLRVRVLGSLGRWRLLLAVTAGMAATGRG